MLVVSTVLSGALYLAGPQATLSTYFAEFWGKSWFAKGGFQERWQHGIS